MTGLSAYKVGDEVVFATVSGDATILNDHKCRILEVNMADDAHTVYVVEFDKLRVSAGEFELHDIDE
jgi:hypothetical protein